MTKLLILTFGITPRFNADFTSPSTQDDELDIEMSRIKRSVFWNIHNCLSFNYSPFHCIMLIFI